MNRIVKNVDGTYTLHCENGKTYPCKRWLEKKKDGRQYWHVCPLDGGKEACGRTYIRESFFENSDVYEFETKTEHREGLGNGGWKSRLTEEELKEYQFMEQRMEELKELALSRPVKELTEEEKLEREIQRLLEKKKRLYGGNEG